MDLTVHWRDISYLSFMFIYILQKLYKAILI